MYGEGDGAADDAMVGCGDVVLVGKELSGSNIEVDVNFVEV